MDERPNIEREVSLEIEHGHAAYTDEELLEQSQFNAQALLLASGRALGEDPGATEACRVPRCGARRAFSGTPQAPTTAPPRTPPSAATARTTHRSRSCPAPSPPVPARPTPACHADLSPHPAGPAAAPSRHVERRSHLADPASFVNSPGLARHVLARVAGQDRQPLPFDRLVPVRHRPGHATGTYAPGGPNPRDRRPDRSP